MAMNCETFKSNIDAYIDGALGRDERLMMEKHAEGCASCRELMKEALMLMDMCAELSEVSVPLQAQAAWRKAVRDEAKKKKNPMAGWTRSLATVAAALVVLVMSTYTVRLGRDVPAAPAAVITLDTESGFALPASEQEYKNERESGTALLGGYVMTGLQSDGAANGARTMQEEDIVSSANETVVLKSAARSIQSENYDTDVQWLNDLVSEYDAWFEERSETAADELSSAGRTLSAAVRVPSDRLGDFLMELDQLGRTVLRSESAEDVTGRYMDTQSRLNAMKLQKQKLDEMLAAASTVDELIAIDQKMTEVIGSIESLEGDLRRWESLRSYSTVELTLTEQLKAPVQAPASLGERMKQGFSDSVQWLKEFGQDALVVLATAVPKLVVWIPALALVIAAVCMIRAKKRRG